MTMRAPAPPAPRASAPFQQGQVWQIGDLNVAVTLVGKTLVHYKRYRKQTRGAQTALTSKTDFQKYLKTNKAVLVSE